MNLLTNFIESFANLLGAKLRSFLAILGILVGTGSVVALIYCGQLATAHALAQFKSLGTNLESVSLYDQSQGGKSQAAKKQLTLDMMPEIKAVSNQIVEIAPYTSTYQSYFLAGISDNGQILGATAELADIAKIGIVRGRFVSSMDKHEKYCVIGSGLAKKVQAKGVDPLYKQIVIGKYIFTVIGIAKPWKPSFFFYANIDDGVIIPIGSSFYLGSNVAIHNLLFKLIKKPNLPLVQSKLHAYFKRFFPSLSSNFQNPEQIIHVVAKQRRTFSLLLSAIGGISLIVGGIGVMNIMLVSVIERRREIGVRMAIGAKRRDVLRMFLIESIMLTLFGGVLGIILGISAAFFIAKFSHWEFFIFMWPIELGFVVAVLVGVLSGYYPALSASKLDPIDCLRSE